MKKIIVTSIIILMFCFSVYSENENCPLCPYDNGMPEEDKKVVDEAKKKDPGGKLIFLGYNIERQGNVTLVYLGFYNNTNKIITSFVFESNFTDSYNNPSYFIFSGKGYKQYFINSVSETVAPKTNIIMEYRIFVDIRNGFKLKNCKVKSIRFEDGTVWNKK